jgi:20S proteasome alpha/beta subunit
MTLIVGIKCANGLVLGADGASTLGAPGQPTALQPYGKKLHSLHDSVVFGFSGYIGIGQRLEGILSELYQKEGTDLLGSPLRQ